MDGRAAVLQACDEMLSQVSFCEISNMSRLIRRRRGDDVIQFATFAFEIVWIPVPFCQRKGFDYYWTTKIGELKIRELRARAEAELGSSFDIRRFHDKVVGNGSLPIKVLEETVVDWISAEDR